MPNDPSGDGWMLLGDAAGLVDPITREGIFFALRSGMLAAAALGSGSPARAYADAVRDELHDELRRAARLKAGFFRPRFTSLLIDALESERGDPRGDARSRRRPPAVSRAEAASARDDGIQAGRVVGLACPSESRSPIPDPRSPIPAPHFAR